MLIHKLADYFSNKTLLKIYRLTNDLYYKNKVQTKLGLDLVNLREDFSIYYNNLYFILCDNKLEIHDKIGNNITGIVIENNIILEDYTIITILDYITMLDTFKSLLEEYYLDELIIKNSKRQKRIGFAHDNIVCKDIVTGG